MTELAIEIKGLHKIYRRGFLAKKEICAVRNLNLEIKSGEAWALVGPNGAGKTTTLHCLVGLLNPTSGSITIFGENPLSPDARRKVGFQSEIFFSYSYMNPVDGLKFYGRLSGLKDPDLKERVTKALNLAGLSDCLFQTMGTFSKGMMQRVGLAQSILHDPSVIIWDEPSTGLDPEGRRLVMDLILKLKSEGKTVLLSTHILSDIERVCDHISIINKGGILLSESIDSLLTKHSGKTLEDIYLETVRGKADAQ